MDKKKNLIIGTLLAAIVLMSVGYAALAQVLTINGTANVTGKWDVQVTGITEGATMTGATTKTSTYNATSATFAVDLAYPGATATYEVAIENKGTINAKLESITGVDAANATAPSEIQYTVTNVTVGDALNASATTKAIVTVKWVASAGNTDTIPTTTSKTATINLNYVQNT